MQIFVDREREVDTLLNWISGSGLRIAVVYGRRRIGKTWIVKRVMREVGGEYVFVPEASERYLLPLVGNALSSVSGCTITKESWHGIAEELADCRSGSGGILYIDEFQRLTPAFASAIQYLYDMNPGLELKLILLGSAVSVVDRLAGPMGPLYGRSLIVKLPPFSFPEAYTLLREKTDASPLEAFHLYTVLGGSPFNLSLAESRDWRREADRLVHNVYGLLYEDPLHILYSETREPGVYMAILETIASGRRGYSDIARVTGRTSVKHYVELLASLGIVERITPALEPGLRTRKSRYHIVDPYWDYWFKIVYPRRGEAELYSGIDPPEEVARRHFSWWMEEVARGLLSIIHGRKAVPWWSRSTEIDAVIEYEDGSIGVYEVKYGVLDKREAGAVAKALRRKAVETGRPLREVGVVALDYEEKPLDDTVAYLSLGEVLEKALEVRPVSVTGIE